MWKGPNIFRVSVSFVRLRRTFIFYCTESENENSFSLNIGIQLKKEA